MAWVVSQALCLYIVAFASNVRFCRVASASRSEPEYAAKSPVDVVHEGCRRVADRFLKVGLIEGDEGGDVDD